MVDNTSGSSVNATGTWWGQTSTSSSMFNGTISGTHLTFDPTTTPGNDGESPAKRSLSENINFESLYDEVEQSLISAKNSTEISKYFHELYQIEGLAQNLEITNRFEAFAFSQGIEVGETFSSGFLNETLFELAKVLFIKSLIRNEKYNEAKEYLNQTDQTEIRKEFRDDYLHLKVVSEIYEGLYNKAQSTLNELYTLEQEKGKTLQEIEAMYQPIFQDLMIRMDSGYQIKDEKITSLERNKNDFNLQNHPNPFNPTTSISFTLPKRSYVSLSVYDLLGREVSALVNELKDSGSYTVHFDASHLSSGLYIYQLKVGDIIISNRMTLIK